MPTSLDYLRGDAVIKPNRKRQNMEMPTVDRIVAKLKDLGYDKKEGE